VAVPLEDQSGEFGISIRADVNKDELVECARKVLEARGVSNAVSFRQSGSFTWVEPQGDLAKHYPTLAYREGGPYLIARGAWLGAMVDTAEGKMSSARGASVHLTLRRALGQSSDDAPVFAALATVTLPKEMRERIQKEMGKETADGPREATSAALMAGVFGVESAGLAVAAGDAAGADARAVLELRCEDEAARVTVARLIDKNRRSWLGSPAIQILGIGQLLDNLTVDEQGKSLRVTTHAPANEVARWITRAFELRSARRPAMGPVDAPAATPGPSVTSDETVKPRNAPAPAAKNAAKATSDAAAPHDAKPQSPAPSRAPSLDSFGERR
jgi:hypothetical protein